MSVESSIDITARDGKDIFCRINLAAKQPSEKVIILSHGLTGHVNEYIHMAARDYFNERGYDVYRISYYCDGSNHRRLPDTTLQAHANDLNDLISHIKNETEYRKIFVCGHSYGGATILFANPDTTANSFWDSTMYPWEGHWVHYAEKTKSFENGFIESWTGIPMFFGNDMLDEAKNTQPEEMKKRAQNISAPSQVVVAELGDFEEYKRKELFDNLTCQKDYALIEEADHCFTNGHTAKDLYNVTHKWFERF